MATLYISTRQRDASANSSTVTKQGLSVVLDVCLSVSGTSRPGPRMACKTGGGSRLKYLRFIRPCWGGASKVWGEWVPSEAVSKVRVSAH
jgi:hypothetical protein